MANRNLRWEFPQTIFTTTVLPSEFRRTHQEIKIPIVLHNCLNGYNEQGVHVKTLYCTRSGRFFVRTKDGWNEVLPNTTHLYSKHPDKPRPKTAGGGTDQAFLRQFGAFTCHRLVAYAWCKHPKEAKTDPEWRKGYEVDHLNGDHSNWTADNLQWVTPDENRRRARILRQLRTSGTDPRNMTRTDLLALFTANNVAGDVYEGD